MGDAFQPVKDKIVCRSCGAENDGSSRFCVQCGRPLSGGGEEAAELSDPLAQGLPDWDLEPPRVVVRKKGRL